MQQIIIRFKWKNACVLENNRGIFLQFKKQLRRKNYTEHSL